MCSCICRILPFSTDLDHSPGLGKTINNSTQDKTSCQWWGNLVIPALGRLRQEDGEFKASLGCIKTVSKEEHKRDNPSEKKISKEF
jgi:hypothetical protein